ncbi:luciferase family protein [Cystobacter fuscus]|uniref:luciferase domain-containing protein n=1 Tax=Cystobacter fuscus TaxID=43 RepID=UPI002B2D8E19|nr:hypothetical protein F0U63_15175 [Cystobacter fuscus]
MKLAPQDFGRVLLNLLNNSLYAVAEKRKQVGPGFYLKEQDAHGPQEAFLLGLEFAHLHPSPDGSLHLPLPEPLRSKAIASGWAEKHPLAGYPSVSRDIVMVYAPRDPAEIEVVTTLVTASWRYARGSA